MKNFFAALVKFFSSLFGGKPRPPQTRCAFCGAEDHAEEDCPRAAKYKMFGERDG